MSNRKIRREIEHIILAQGMGFADGTYAIHPAVKDEIINRYGADKIFKLTGWKREDDND